MATLSKTKTYSYTFPGGGQFTGTLPQLEDAAKRFGVKLDYKTLGVTPRGYYPSVSKGLIKIADMHEFHVRQAINKRVKDYLAEHCNRESTNKQFVENFIAMADDQILADLFSNLQSRAK